MTSRARDRVRTLAEVLGAVLERVADAIARANLLKSWE